MSVSASCPFHPTRSEIDCRIIPDNYMEKEIIWLRSEKVGLVSKIIYVILPVMAIVGIGSLLGSPILLPMAVFIPMVLWGLTAAKELDRKVKPEYGKIAFESIQDAVGGKPAFESFPIFKLPFEGYASVALEKQGLKPEDLSESIMRGSMLGQDGFEKPFLSLKLYDELSESKNSFVVTLHQFYSNPDSLLTCTWICVSQQKRKPFRAILGVRDLDVLKTIIEKRHARWKLGDIPASAMDLEFE